MWWLAPTIMAGGQLASNVATNIGNVRQQREAFKNNLAMWHLQNEYNHPTQQMNRLREAGINPRLMYGAGGGPAASGTAHQLPKYQAPRMDWRMDMPNVLQSLNLYSDVKVKAAQTDLLNEQKRLAGAQASYYEDIADNRVQRFARQVDYERFRTQKAYREEVISMLMHNMNQDDHYDWVDIGRFADSPAHRAAVARGLLDEWNAYRTKFLAQIAEKDHQYYFWKFLGAAIPRVVVGAIKKIPAKGVAKGYQFKPRPGTRLPSSKDLKISGGVTINDYYNALRNAGKLR